MHLNEAGLLVTPMLPNRGRRAVLVPRNSAIVTVTFAGRAHGDQFPRNLCRFRSSSISAAETTPASSAFDRISNLRIAGLRPRIDPVSFPHPDDSNPTAPRAASNKNQRHGGVVQEQLVHQLRSSYARPSPKEKPRGSARPARRPHEASPAPSSKPAFHAS